MIYIYSLTKNSKNGRGTVMKRKAVITLLMAFLLLFTTPFASFAKGEAESKTAKADFLKEVSDYLAEHPEENKGDGPREAKETGEVNAYEVQYNNDNDMIWYTPKDYQRYPLGGTMKVSLETTDIWRYYYTIPAIVLYKNGRVVDVYTGTKYATPGYGKWTSYDSNIKLTGLSTGVYEVALLGCPGYKNLQIVDNLSDFNVPMIIRTIYITPSGKVTIRNTVANSAKRTNDVIWDKSKVKGATNYQISWRARGGQWAYKNVGNTVRGTTSGLTIGNLYEIRVRPYGAKNSKVYGAWSNSVYRYFHTTQKIRLASRSKGTFTMSWQHNPNATSYQIMYTTSPNGAGAAQNIKTAGRGATSITVGDIKVGGMKTKLVSGRVYYVQIREIRNYAGINYIGNISIPVAVKVK